MRHRKALSSCLNALKLIIQVLCLEKPVKLSSQHWRRSVQRKWKKGHTHKWSLKIAKYIYCYVALCFTSLSLFTSNQLQVQLKSVSGLDLFFFLCGINKIPGHTASISIKWDHVQRTSEIKVCALPQWKAGISHWELELSSTFLHCTRIAPNWNTNESIPSLPALCNALWWGHIRHCKTSNCLYEPQSSHTHS